MIRWLPVIRIGGWTGCHSDGEFEGRYLSITWRRFHCEFGLGVSA